MGNLTTREALSLRWAQIVNDPTLRDLPYKMELNRFGKIEMSPANNRHARLQGYFAGELARQLADGGVLTECPILTEIGVRVPDVAWASSAFLDRNGDTTPFPQAPEICMRRRSASRSSRRPTRTRKCARRRKRISPRERRRCGWWRRKAKCASSTLPASVPRRASASTSRHRPLLRRPELRGGAPDQLALSSRCFVCAERAVQPGLRREATSSPTAPPSASSSPCDPRRSSAATGAHSSP